MSIQSRMMNETQQNYDRTKDLKAFDERKTGVKGLVDEGSKTIPSIFVRPPNDRSKDLSTNHDHNLSVPIIDMSHIGYDDEIISDHQATTKILKEIIWASQNWGFFQVINHGIPLELMENMIEGTRMFHEQDDETKKKFYSRDSSKVVTFNSNYDFYKSIAANWRDTFSVNTSFTGKFDPQELPPMCKEVIVEYIKKVTKLGETILKLISMGLGLKAEYLKEMLECTKAWNLACHYYPACPEPDLTLGTSKHADASFITILLQDQIGGLQVLHFNQWVHVHPLKGAFIVNIGDALQEFAGTPGTVTGLILRIAQFMFAAASIASMATTSSFFNFTAFCYLVASMGLQVIWSLSLALLDAFALSTNQVLHNPILVTIFVIGDWVTATLSLAAASASAGITILYFHDIGGCTILAECFKYQFSVALAFLSWLSAFISSLIMFWLLAAA